MAEDRQNTLFLAVTSIPLMLFAAYFSFNILIFVRSYMMSLARPSAAEMWGAVLPVAAYVAIGVFLLENLISAWPSVVWPAVLIICLISYFSYCILLCSFRDRDGAYVRAAQALAHSSWLNVRESIWGNLFVLALLPAFFLFFMFRGGASLKEVLFPLWVSARLLALTQIMTTSAVAAALAAAWVAKRLRS